MSYYDCSDRVNYLRLEVRINNELAKVKSIYRALFSNLSRCRIKSSLTTSDPVEVLRRFLKSNLPVDILLVLENAVYDQEDGWYKCSFIYQRGKQKSTRHYATRIENGRLRILPILEG